MTVVPIERIEARAREIDPITLGTWIVKCLVWIPTILGWLAAMVFRSVTWFIAALILGFEAGLNKKSGDAD